MNDRIEFETVHVSMATDTVLETIQEYFFKGEEHDERNIEIESKLSNLFEQEFVDDLYCLIEHPYVDRVYRDSYYKYYSSKHYAYKRDSIRVSMFDCEIEQEMFLSKDNLEHLKKHHRGYFTIRPLKNAVFGRSHFDLRLFDFKYDICSFKSSSMVLGVKFKTLGFPHSSQDSETITCAETTIWSLMEYFGTKYPDYSPSLPSKIITSLEPLFYERQLPSAGLSMDAISYALKEFGFGTRLYSEEVHKEEFFDIIHYYIESALPIVLGLESENTKQGHAMVAIGKNYSESTDLNDITPREFEIDNEQSLKYIDFADVNELVIVQDDNLFPYRQTKLKEIGKQLYAGKPEESTYAIDSIVVPLYPKIYLEASLAKKMCLTIVSNKTYGYDFENGFIFRFFLTSSRSIKEHINEIPDLEQDLKYDILVAKMPKFIWCAEIYYNSSFQKEDKIAEGLIILDATEANKESADALIFAGYPDRCISMVDNKFVYLQAKLSNYRFYNNF